ncbi:hypothetical protein F5Y12DRAFT_336667 [Xylaria sp. FL1777]|nr:hypothetical protein F5Y12DRAFT_336667 [Xylaria sp. FL1777]
MRNLVNARLFSLGSPYHLSAKSQGWLAVLVLYLPCTYHTRNTAPHTLLDKSCLFVCVSPEGLSRYVPSLPFSWAKRCDVAVYPLTTITPNPSPPNHELRLSSPPGVSEQETNHRARERHTREQAGEGEITRLEEVVSTQKTTLAFFVYVDQLSKYTMYPA